MLKKVFGLKALIPAVLLLCVPAPVAARDMPPASAFAALPRISNIAISADGKKIAFGNQRPDQTTEVRVYNLDTKQAVSIGLGKNILRDVTFEDGGMVLVTASDTSDVFTTKVELYRTFAIDLEAKTARNLLADGGAGLEFNSGISLISYLPDEPDAVMMSAFERTGVAEQYTKNLYRVGTKRPRDYKMVTRGKDTTYDWQTDNQGNPVARLDHDPRWKVTTLFLYDSTKNPREVIRMEGTPTRAMRLRGFTKRGRIVLSQADDTEFGKLISVDPANGTVSDYIKMEDVEFEGSLTDPWTQEVVGVRTGGLEPYTQLIAPEWAALMTSLEVRFPNRIIELESYSKDKNMVVFSVGSSSRPTVYYLLNQATKALVMLGETLPDLNAVPMGDVRATTFKSRDGVDIPVYVTTPPGKADIKKAPTIIFPHGGPEARDAPEFDWWAQFMATRGYVVIQPQFRGSTGFGASFSEAGYRQWGKRMQDDVSDAVGWAIKEGITDASRVCIVGASYGGYTSLAGATLTPELYKCAVSVGGVSDLPSMMEAERSDANGDPSSTVNYWAEHIGSDDRPAMVAASPRRLVSRIRAPILLIHGKEDTVVRFEQTKDMANAMRTAGKPYKLVELKDEDHWLSRPTTRLQMLTEIEVFLQEHLGPGVE